MCSYRLNLRKFHTWSMWIWSETKPAFNNVLSSKCCCKPTPSLLQWASYQIRKIAGCACAGNAGNVFPRRWFQRKLLVSDHGMHHGTCVTHVPWCMSGSLTCGDGENVPGIPGACAPAILRIWQEAHREYGLTYIANGRNDHASNFTPGRHCDIKAKGRTDESRSDLFQ